MIRNMSVLCVEGLGSISGKLQKRHCVKNVWRLTMRRVENNEKGGNDLIW